MNISTKAPQTLKWVAFSVTFSVFLLVNFTTHNLYADGGMGIDPPDENQVFIDVGTCHTPNFALPASTWEWINSVFELFKPTAQPTPRRTILQAYLRT